MTDRSAEHGVEPGRSVDRAAGEDQPHPPDVNIDSDVDERGGGELDGTSGAWKELSTGDRRAEDPAQGMLPARRQRRTKLERGSMRVLATGGIVGLATILGAVLVAQDVAGWIVGLAIGLTSVVLAAILWSSRQL
jgi:hypothetical protein